MAKTYYDYFNQYTRDHYDRINIVVPKGYRERVKAVANDLGMSVSEYIFTLICNDMNGTGGSIKEQRQSFSEEHKEMLKKLQVPKKYFEMIEDMSYSKENGYYIHLKDGYVNDISGSRNIYARTTKDVRVTIGKTHKVGEQIAVKTVKQEPVIDWLSEQDIKQLEKWQIPKKYYPMIESISYNGYSAINLKEGYFNDATGSRIISVSKVAEFKSIMKYTHKMAHE